MEITQNSLIKIMLTIMFLFFIIQCRVDSADFNEYNKCASLLPKDAREAITKSYKNFRILEKADLNHDDQILWRKYRSKECPGVVTGNFDSANKKAYAVLIISQTPKEQAKLLILKMNNLDKYKIDLLYEEDNVTNFPAIHKGLPGIYADFYDNDKKVKVKTDLIIYEHIETSAIAFYYTNGKYKQVLVSD